MQQRRLELEAVAVAVALLVRMVRQLTMEPWAVPIQQRQRQ